MPQFVRRPPHVLLVPLVLLATSGCDVPEYEGPQVQSPPPGFTLNPDTYQERSLFPDLERTHHDAWVEASWGNFSGIYINGWPGALSRADAEAARDAAMRANAGRRIEYGEVEELTVDERTAWGWTEWWRLENGGLEYVAYRAVVPYDTLSYAVEFLTGDPALKIRPDSLRTIVATFAVGKTRWNLPLFLIMAGVLLLLGNTVRARQARKAARARNIRLVQMPKKEEKPEGAVPGALAPGGAPKTGGAEGSSIADAITRDPDDKEPPTG